MILKSHSNSSEWLHHQQRLSHISVCCSLMRLQPHTNHIKFQPVGWGNMPACLLSPSESEEVALRRRQSHNRRWIHTGVCACCARAQRHETHTTLPPAARLQKRKSWNFWAGSLASYLHQIKANLINSSVF